MFFLRFIIFKLQEICLPDSLLGLQHVFTKNITKMGSLVLREPRKIGVVRTGVNFKSVHENRPKTIFSMRFSYLAYINIIDSTSYPAKMNWFYRVVQKILKVKITADIANYEDSLHTKDTGITNKLAKYVDSTCSILL